MHKILLSFLLFLAVVIFPKSEVFSITVPPCKDQEVDLTPIETTTKLGQCAQTEAICYDFKESGFSGTTWNCFKAGDTPADGGKATGGIKTPPVTATAIQGYECKTRTRDITETYCDKDTEGQRIINGKCYCVEKSTPPQPGEESRAEICDPNKKNCTSGSGLTCSEGITSGSGIRTAIGCVPTEPKALVEGLLKYGTLAAGGVAFLIMLLAALQMITAEGNPEAIKGAQEKFYSAIIGLLLIIFSVLLMQVIGVDILGLPEFGGNEPPPPSTRDPNS